MNEINIAISGVAGSGKSRLMWLINQMLTKEGFNVSLAEDNDYSSAEDMASKLSHDLPQAIEAIKSRLALEAIVKAEKIEASEEKINEKLEEMAKNYGKTAEELKANENVKNYIKEGIESQEAIEFLVKNAKIK